MKSFVLGFSGKIGSGKSSIAAVTASALNIPCVSFGDYIRKVAEYLGLNPGDRGVLQEIGNLLVKYPNEFCLQVLQQADYHPGNPLVIEGIRHKQILDALKALIAPAELILVYVKTNEGIIEERLHQEGIPEIRIHQLEQDATEAQVTTLLPKLADLVIDNSRERSSDEIQMEVVPIIGAFLEKGEHNLPDVVPFKPIFGGSKGLFQMSEDFDQPLEDFADYT